MQDYLRNLWMTFYVHLLWCFLEHLHILETVVFFPTFLQTR